MNVINKQKFLAELGRLLTFMYEEDRQTALAMYSKMFDDAAEEQLLLQFLISPTRQAVLLARSYDAKERKLQVHTQSREEEPDYSDYDGQFPPFILAIDDLQQAAAAQGIFSPGEEAQPVDEDQFSLFDEISSQADGPDTDREEKGSAAEDTTLVVEDPRETAVEPQAEKDSVSQFADAVDAFLADFSIADGELISKHSQQEAREPEAPAEADAPEETDAPQFDDQPFRLEELSHAAASQETPAEEPAAVPQARDGSDFGQGWTAEQEGLSLQYFTAADGHDYLVSLLTTDPTLSTPRGIQCGDSAAAVQEAYPADLTKDDADAQATVSLLSLPDCDSAWVYHPTPGFCRIFFYMKADTVTAIQVVNGIDG